MNRDISGILVAIDFEKAFDSLHLISFQESYTHLNLVLLSFSGYESCMIKPPAML